MSKIVKVPGGFNIIHSTNGTILDRASTRAEANKKKRAIHKRNGIKPPRRKKAKTKKKKSNTFF